MISTEMRLQRRAAALARGLRAVGVEQGQAVVVFCCPRHQEDRLVALAALQVLGATGVEPVNWDTATIRSLNARTASPGIQLACEEGVSAWRAAQGRGIMIGEGEGVMWWKALECRFYMPAVSASPLPAQRGA